MIELSGITPDIAQENMEPIKKLFPEVFTEGKIDFDELKQVPGEYVKHRHVSFASLLPFLII